MKVIIVKFDEKGSEGMVTQILGTFVGKKGIQLKGNEDFESFEEYENYLNSKGFKNAELEIMEG